MPSPDFRARVRDWFAEHTPARWQAELDAASDDEFIDFNRRWLTALQSEGFAAPHVPVDWGGGGYTMTEQAVIYEEWARAQAPPLDVFAVSLHHVPSTFLKAGSAQQQHDFIADALAGTVWCQGFSEPDAGSDLASLRTRAEPDGDDYVVNGQKVWSSYAQFAKWCLLLARTDADAPKHKGISYFVMDMDAPGVEVRPIRQNTGHAEFNEMFLTDVRIPASRVVGTIGDGWRIAQETLSTERGPLAVQMIEQIAVGLDDLVDRAAPADVARVIARCDAVRSLAWDMIDRGATELASASKVASSRVLRAMTDLGALLDDTRSLLDPGQRRHRGYVSGDWIVDYVNSWSWSIAAGTDEIQRNIIAERLLGLPREPRP